MEITGTAAKASDAVGMKVSYEDQANPRRFGVITAYVPPTRFSGHYVVTWDHDGWSDQWSKETRMEIPALKSAQTNKYAGWRVEPSDTMGCSDCGSSMERPRTSGQIVECGACGARFVKDSAGIGRYD